MSRKRRIAFKKQISVSELQKYVAMTMGFLLVIFIIAQFVVLDLAGIHGPEITKLRNEQDELKLEIELKRAEMNDMTTSATVKTYAQNSLGYKPTSVRTITQTDEVQASLASLE